MIGAEPKVGWVLRYSYLWSEESATDLGAKERPAVIVLAVTRAADRILVRVAPVTHRPPGDASRAIEIPAVTKARLGLDPVRSWIVLDHANEFVWPGPDVRPVPGTDPATIYYGPLPPKLFATVRRRLLALLATRPTASVFRPD